MATSHTASVCDNSTTAGFRAWGLEFNGMLAACSPLLQTSDTGQIDWTSVTLPGAGADAGFEIWQLNDTLFSTAPVFFKIVYGTNAAGTSPQLKIQVGTATNGAGTLSGTCLSAVNYLNYVYASVSTTTIYDSYVCAHQGFFGLWHKATPAAGPAAVDGAFIFNRTCDTSGAPTAEGAHAYWGCAQYGYSTGHQSYRYASPQTAFPQNSGASGGGGNFCLATQQAPSSVDAAGNTQAYVHYTITPTVEPLFGSCTVRASDVSQGTIFTVPLVGTTPRSYLATRPGGGGSGYGFAESAASANYAMAFLYE